MESNSRAWCQLSPSWPRQQQRHQLHLQTQTVVALQPWPMLERPSTSAVAGVNALVGSQPSGARLPEQVVRGPARLMLPPAITTNLELAAGHGLEHRKGVGDTSEQMEVVPTFTRLSATQVSVKQSKPALL